MSESEKADAVAAAYLQGVRGEQYVEPLPIDSDPETRVAEEYVRAVNPNPDRAACLNGDVRWDSANHRWARKS